MAVADEPFGVTALTVQLVSNADSGSVKTNRPSDEMVLAGHAVDHVTCLAEIPETLAVNCVLPEFRSVYLAGTIVITTGGLRRRR